LILIATASPPKKKTAAVVEKRSDAYIRRLDGDASWRQLKLSGLCDYSPLPSLHQSHNS